jgi:hypothetical protein
MARAPSGSPLGRRGGIGLALGPKRACQITESVATCACTDTVVRPYGAGTKSGFRSSLIRVSLVA